MRAKPLIRLQSLGWFLERDPCLCRDQRSIAERLTMTVIDSFSRAPIS